MSVASGWVHWVVMNGVGMVAMLWGALLQPDPGALPAVEGLAAGPSRALPLRSRDEVVVHREMTLHGLPVRGAYEVVRQPARGEPQRLVSRSPRRAPSLTPAQARIGAEQLPARLAALGLPAPSEPPTLVYRLVLGVPVLAWEVRLPLILQPVPSLPLVWISARSGRRIDQTDTAFHSRARVFPEDPSTTPDPVEVELSTLSWDGPGQRLLSESYEVLGCGQGPIPDDAPGWVADLGCVPQSLALSDESGDFFPPLPDIVRLEDNRDRSDPYAEVAAYHFTERFFDTLRDRGLTQARCERFTIVVNRHGLDDEGNPQPIDGATFIDQCDPAVTPTIVVGQGRDVDWAWDGDVMFHELGHSVIQDLSPGGLSKRNYAVTGILSEAGAINEGLADYFAMTVSDDPETAEYAARFSGSGTRLSDGNNQKVCPDDLISGWHHDGQTVSASLWAMRERLGPHAVDGMLLETLPRLAPDSVLDDFGSRYLEVALRWHEDGALTDFELGMVERSLHARGLIACLHVIDDPDLATTGKRMELVGRDDMFRPFAPGPLQLRYEVPDDATEVTLFASLSGGEPSERALSFLVGRQGQPVHFEYVFLEEGDDEGIEVSGDHDVEVEAESLNGEDFIARLAVEPGEVLHVSLANRSPQGVTASNVFVVASEPTLGEPPVEEGGCGCRGQPSAPAGLVLGLGLLALVGRRRRSSAC